MRLVRYIRLFFRLPAHKRVYLTEAVICLLITRPFAGMQIKRWAGMLGEPQTETTYEDDPALRSAVVNIRWAIDVASRRVPWRSDCLPQAFAANLMLKRRKISNTVYLGVMLEQASADQAAMKAHAWVRVGSVIITGEAGHKEFRPVSTFASKPS